MVREITTRKLLLFTNLVVISDSQLNNKLDLTVLCYADSYWCYSSERCILFIKDTFENTFIHYHESIFDY